MVWLLEAVFDHQIEVVALVEDLAVDLGVELLEPPHLSVLLGDELLVHRRDLDVEVVVGQVEVRREILGRDALPVPGEGEGPRFVLPGNTVEIEEKGELTLTVVSKLGLGGRMGFGDQGAPASTTPASSVSG
jgi:hypothetical protein